MPIPEQRGDSIATDFIGPLPEDDGFNCIATFTDRLGLDIRIVPTHTNLTAEKMAALFFDHWYCENGLPLQIVSDCNKLFVSKFWKALHRLTVVKLAMSSLFHPQTDGASERSDKTVNQSIRYHVDHQQHGWVKALPRIRFGMMNTLNVSTGYSGFQLKMGRSPHIILPLVPASLAPGCPQEDINAARVIDKLLDDTASAKDNLIQANVAQASYANRSRKSDFEIGVGDRVMLSTFHRRRDYKNGDKNRMAKFMPRYDGPYTVTHSNPSLSLYTLDIPNSPAKFNTFHISELRAFVPNNSSLFPSHEHPRPGPVLTEDGLKEHLIDHIVDERRQGRGFQYLVRWVGYGPEDDNWLSQRELEDCKALNVWLAHSVASLMAGLVSSGYGRV